MGFNFTNNVTVNGANNLLALLIAAGYQGGAIVEKEGTIYNPSATVPAYLYFTDSKTNAPGVRQVESTPVVGTITGAGNATFTITAAGMTNSPKAISVPVTLGMTPAQVCQAAAMTLNSDVDVSAFFDVSITANNILVLTKKTTAANDGTMNIAYTNGTCTGLTPDATSDDTTAGALYTTQGLPILIGAPAATTQLVQGTDLSTTWLYTASSIPLAVGVQG